MQLTPIAACVACALLLAGMVAAQPPLPPPGVNSMCSAALTRMANTSTAPAQAVPCPGGSGQIFCPTSIYSEKLQCGPVGPDLPCEPYGMLPPFQFWAQQIPIPPYDGSLELISCIPHNSTIPKPGVVCNALLLDDNMDNDNYIDSCHREHGNDMQKNIDLVWGSEFTCKGGAGTTVPCLMHTEVIACMPADCTASDIALVGAMETKALCATLTPYNLSSCGVKYVSDDV